MGKSKLGGASLQQAIPGPSQKDMDYETEGHLRTLGDAADIISDPHKLKRVHKLAGRRHKALAGLIGKVKKDPKINSLDDLRKVANKGGIDKMDDDGDED